MRTATRGAFAASPPSVPQFPLPHSDDFDAYVTSQEARYFADQIGAWEIHPSPTASNASNKALKQMVPQLPIGWSDHGSNGPMTLIGTYARVLEWHPRFYVPLQPLHFVRILLTI